MLLAALWLENRVLVSMASVGVLPLELVWLIDFLFGGKLIGIAAYMFGSTDMAMYLRVLSGFHFFLPPTMLYLLWRWGYDKRALPYQTILALAVLPVTYLVTDPAGENINWVYGPGYVQDIMAPALYLILWMLVLPICVLIPTHFILKKLFAKPHLPHDSRTN